MSDLVRMRHELEAGDWGRGSLLGRMTANSLRAAHSVAHPPSDDDFGDWVRYLIERDRLAQLIATARDIGQVRGILPQKARHFLRDRERGSDQRWRRQAQHQRTTLREVLRQEEQFTQGPGEGRNRAWHLAEHVHARAERDTERLMAAAVGALDDAALGLLPDSGVDRANPVMPRRGYVLLLETALAANSGAAFEGELADVAAERTGLVDPLRGAASADHLPDLHADDDRIDTDTAGRIADAVIVALPDRDTALLMRAVILGLVESETPVSWLALERRTGCDRRKLKALWQRVHTGMCALLVHEGYGDAATGPSQHDRGAVLFALRDRMIAEGSR